MPAGLSSPEATGSLLGALESLRPPIPSSPTPPPLVPLCYLGAAVTVAVWGVISKEVGAVLVGILSVLVVVLWFLSWWFEHVALKREWKKAVQRASATVRRGRGAGGRLGDIRSVDVMRDGKDKKKSGVRDCIFEICLLLCFVLILFFINRCMGIT